ncbi:MAG: Bax inhibitor-1/YccA family protein [Bacteriovoracia bacterium]
MAFNSQRQTMVVLSPDQQLAVSRFMSKTYGWMTIGVALTAVVSWVVASNEALSTYILMNRWLMMLLIFGELGLVMGLSFAFNRLSPAAATGGFLFYAALSGVTFSTLFFVYTMQSITQIFFITACMFGGLALFGTVTKRNLSAMGTFMMMGVWGLILVGIVNLFVGSESLSLGMSVAGVVIFAGLTAWDAQKIKYLAFQSVIESRPGSEGVARKTAILGALMLYLDFVNLFLNLLRLFGGRRE